MTRALPHAASAPRPVVGLGALRMQVALVIGLLALLPNVLMALTLAYVVGLPDLGILLAWLLALVFVLGGLGYFLSRALLRPLSRLEDEVRAGHFQAARPDDPGEVRALREAFSRLLSRLTTEQARRGAFMATLVHDLKTPLIASSHLVAALRGEGVPPGERDLVYAQLLGENARLLGLVQQMADAHKFERETVILHRSDVNLRSLADRLAASFEPRAFERDLTFELRGEGVAFLDAAQFERAVTNLLDNALRYARSKVRLEIAPTAVRVLDDGPGLARPLADLAQPFNAQPVEIAGQRYTAGTAGLGLFIARRVAEAHGAAFSYAREVGWSVFELKWEGEAVVGQGSEVEVAHAPDPRPAPRDGAWGAP